MNNGNGHNEYNEDEVDQMFDDLNFINKSTDLMKELSHITTKEFLNAENLPLIIGHILTETSKEASAEAIKMLMDAMQGLAEGRMPNSQQIADQVLSIIFNQSAICFAYGYRTPELVDSSKSE